MKTTSTRQSRWYGPVILLGSISGCSGPDLSVPDLSVPDLSVPDLSVPDLAMGRPDRSLPDLRPLLLGLSAVSPPLGPSSGGLPVTLAGAGFTAGATVTFGGGVAATKVQVISATQMTVLLPPRPGVQGRVPVTVTTADGSSATRDDLFSYYLDRFAVGPQTRFATGELPFGIAIGDLNGDNKPDLVVADNGFNDVKGDVSVLLGNGDGTFQPARSILPGVGNPFSVAIGDLNGDNKPDLAVTNDNGNNVWILLGNGDGTFGAASSILVGDTPRSVAIGDLDGDGKPDLAVANTGGGTVSILLGHGDGTFQPASNLPVGANPRALAVLDLDGDNRPDLVTANYDQNDVSVFLSNGDGTFQPPQSFPVGANPQALASLDLNGDGKPDLAVANCDGGDVSVLLGNGDGTFQPVQSFPTGILADSCAHSVAGLDLNGDGKPDLAVANRYIKNVSVLLGNGDGTFQPAQSFAAGTYPTSVAIADLNGDNKPDIAVANESSSDAGSSSDVSVLLNTSQ